jgi:hypothetical protein
MVSSLGSLNPRLENSVPMAEIFSMGASMFANQILEGRMKGGAVNSEDLLDDSGRIS